MSTVFETAYCNSSNESVCFSTLQHKLRTTYLALLHKMLLHGISAENQTRAEESTIHLFSMVKMDSEQAATKTQRNSEINPSAWFDIKQNLQKTWCFKWKHNCFFEYFICRNDFVRVLKWLPGTLEHFAFSCLFFPAIPHRRFFVTAWQIQHSPFSTSLHL